MSNQIDIQPVSSFELLNDMLLVGIDFANGWDIDVLTVGKREGDRFHVVNTFQEKRARTIFDILTLKEEDLKPWDKRTMNLICPYCQSTFDDDLAWVHGEYRLPKYCPDCGHPIRSKTDET